MMNNDVFFKYRSLQNWKFVLDIFLNRRLYAAKFKEMNDPMEGRYFYYKDEVTDELVSAIGRQKDEWNICSLSRNHRNTLMWSYYSEGHKGIALGIKVRNVGQNRYIVRDVTYDLEVRLDYSKISAGPEEVSLHILSQKQNAWRHEDEVRIFSRTPYVDIEIEQVCFGCLIDRTDRELITALVKKTAPHAKLVDIDRSELDEPLERFRAGRTVPRNRRPPGQAQR